MRESLFRGKRKDNGEWVEGYYVPVCFWGDNMMFVRPYRYPIEVIPKTVGEWTGRLLNNSATYKEEKLFEGDVIGWSEDYDDKFGYPATAYGKGVIVWNETNCCFGVKTSETNIKDFNDFDFDDSCVIIGNIFDNLELIGGEKE